MLGLLDLLVFRTLRLTCSLTRTILDLIGLLDLRGLRLAHSIAKLAYSLAEPASLAYAHQKKFEKITFFCENPDLRTKGFLFKNYF